jgi:hypothetical protein
MALSQDGGGAGHMRGGHRGAKAAGVVVVGWCAHAGGSGASRLDPHAWRGDIG